MTELEPEEPLLPQASLCGFQADESKPVIGLDFDGCAYGFVEAVQAYVRDAYDVHLRLEDLLPNFTLLDWVSTSDAPENRKQDIKNVALGFQTGKDQGFFYRCVHPLPGAKLAVNRLAEHFQVRAFTSRPISLRAVTLKMIARDFPVIQVVRHVTSKGNAALDARAAWMIEDNATAVEECLKKRVRTIHVRHPWSRAVVHPPGLWRLEEVTSLLEASAKILEYVSKREGEKNLVESS